MKFQVLLILVALISKGESGSVEIDNGKYLLETSSNEQLLNVTITALTRGFIGWGISPTGDMAFSDIVICGINSTSGEAYIRDSYATGTSTPTLDASQDVKLISAMENATHTMCVFQRLLNTGDEWDDLSVENRSQFILWAYGETDDIRYHNNNRGAVQFNLMQ
jgi:hypothetical protein